MIYLLFRNSKNPLMYSKCVLLVTILSLPVWAGGKPNPAAGTAPPAVPGEIRVLNETQPPGGTVQLKFMLTEPTPISSGTQSFAFGGFFDTADGIELFSSTGDVFGAAVVLDGSIRINYLSPNGTFGSSIDYPLLTVAAHIRPDAVLGQSTQVALSPDSWWLSPLGQAAAFVPKPGTIAVGGSVSIANVIPGGGAWPAGTIIRVLGQGFQKNTNISSTFKTSNPTIVNGNEIDLQLREPATIDGQSISVKNPDGSSDTYFSYLRGVAQGQSADSLLASTVPIFSTTTHTAANVIQNSRGINQNVITGLAIQNPGATTASISLEASTPMSGAFATTSISLPFGAKITRELGEFFQQTLQPGTTVRIISNVPVQLVGLLADHDSNVVLPFSPAF